MISDIKPMGPFGFIVLRRILFSLSALPALRLLYFIFIDPDALGANPSTFILQDTGTWGLIFLCLSLSVRPWVRISGGNRWIVLRRMFGLYSFFYALLHVLLWAWVDHAFSFAEIAKDIVQRPFIAAGLIAFSILLLLAITSGKAMIRRLGRRWTPLHRSVYIGAIAIIVHYWWDKASKNDLGTVFIYAGIVAFLLGIRLLPYFRRRR